MNLSASFKGKGWKLPFFTIWTGQAFSLLGSSLVQFALVWYLTQKTGSATVLATATLVGILPQIFIGPLVGVLVDRWDRRRMMIFADGISALAVVVLAVLFWLGQAQVWHIYALMFLRSVAGGFHWPAMQASTTLMVPNEHLSRIQGLNQMLQGLVNIGAAPIGALLLGLLPMQGLLAIDVVTAMIAITPLLFVAIPQPERTITADETGSQSAGAGLKGMFVDFKAGLRYVFAWPGLLLILLMATIINLLLTPSGALQPILVTNHFQGGAFHLAWLESAWGVGVVVGGLLLGAWGGFKRRILTTNLGLILLGASVLGVGLLPAGGFWWSVVLMAVTGISLPIVNGPLMAVTQSIVAPEMQGRVFTLISSFASAMSPLGLIIAGPLADRLGVQMWYIIGGIVTAALGVGALFVPAIMNIESDRRKVTSGLADGPENNRLAAKPELAPVSLKIELD